MTNRRHFTYCQLNKLQSATDDCICTRPEDIEGAMTNQQPNNTPQHPSEFEQNKRDIIASVANDYYEQLKNEAPYLNMKFEELGCVCRDFATRDVQALIDAAVAEAVLAELRNAAIAVGDNHNATIKGRIVALRAKGKDV